MEKHKCKLCLKSFANGRALGGHVRSHMLNLYVPPKTKQPNDPLIDDEEEEESAATSSSSEEDEEEKGPFGYGLRENPKKSIRVVDPEFSSVVLQDRESETESSKNRVFRRSKRIRKPSFSDHHSNQYWKKPKMVKVSKTNESKWVDPEFPVSSVSDTTTEEDVAYCLMMLSRDKWMREKVHDPDEEDEEINDEDEQSDYESDHEIRAKPTRARNKYVCETCNKVFRSYQALGGHRASHKKIKSVNHNSSFQIEEREKAMATEGKIHECPVCFRVFASGQALGGHKRSHVTTSSAINAAASVSSTITAKPVTKHGESIAMIDLNLPAPVDEEDEISQIELSAVSDGEFVKY